MANGNNIYINNAGQPTDNNTIYIGNSDNTACYIFGISGVVGAGTTVEITTSGQLINPSSSRRYKDNIESLPEISDQLMQLEPVQFTYKTDADNRKQYGLIAEDVLSVYPELVVHNQDGAVETVRYSQLHALLLKGWQEQQEEIQILKQQHSEQYALLNAKIEALEQKIGNGSL